MLMALPRPADRREFRDQDLFPVRCSYRSIGGAPVVGSHDSFQFLTIVFSERSANSAKIFFGKRLIVVFRRHRAIVHSEVAPVSWRFNSWIHLVRRDVLDVRSNETSRPVPASR